MTRASEKRSEQKEYGCRNTENSDDDCLDVPRRLVDEGEDVHHLKKERRQHSGGAAGWVDGTAAQGSGD